VRYDWKFFEDDIWHNDSGATPTYIYSEPGVYNVTLRVFDDEGSSDIDTTIVIISKPNVPPENPTITGPDEGFVNVSYTYNISAVDEDGDNITYVIDWGDGNTSISDPIPSGDLYQVSHIWTTPGNYTITVTALDEEGVPSEKETFDIQINDTPKPKKEDNTLCYLLLLILILIIIAIILYLLKRRKKKETPKPPTQ